MGNIQFEPWIGKDYEANGGIFGKKILILGESVYCGERCSPCEGCDLFTIDCVNTYVNNDVYDEKGEFRRWTNTYNKFESALVGKHVPIQDRSKVWNSIVFYNFFQTALNKAREPLGGELEYDRANDCLRQVLLKLKPQAIIVWGYRLWECLSGENWINTPPIINFEKESRTGYYLINDIKFPFMCINHPSSGFSWTIWHQNIKKFLESC